MLARLHEDLVSFSVLGRDLSFLPVRGFFFFWTIPLRDLMLRLGSFRREGVYGCTDLLMVLPFESQK